jgi:hypothetical protein
LLSDPGWLNFRPSPPSKFLTARWSPAMSSSLTPRPIIRLDWPFNADPPELYCPRTGELVVSNGEDEVEQPASPHVTFVYPEVVGEFVYLRDDLRERLEATCARLVAAGADPDDLVDIEVLLEHTPLGEVPMVYELRTSGMACGPVSHRLWVGFDLAD